MRPLGFDLDSAFPHKNLSDATLRFKPLNLLFGQTGAGKSNLLELLGQTANAAATGPQIRWFRHVDFDPTWDEINICSLYLQFDTDSPLDRQRLAALLLRCAEPTAPGPPTDLDSAVSRYISRTLDMVPNELHTDVATFLHEAMTHAMVAVGIGGVLQQFLVRGASVRKLWESYRSSRDTTASDVDESWVARLVSTDEPPSDSSLYAFLPPITAEDEDGRTIHYTVDAPEPLVDVCWLDGDFDRVAGRLDQWLETIAERAADSGCSLDPTVEKIELPEGPSWAMPNRTVKDPGGLEFLVPDAGTYLTTAAHEAARTALENEASRLLPSWCLNVGALRIVPRPIELQKDSAVNETWGDGPLVFLGDDPADQLSSGQQRWVAICLELAARRLSRSWTSPTSPELMLVDEPEAHLHPVAQREAALWLQRASTDSTWVVATHSPALLNLPTPGVAFNLVTPIDNEYTERATVSIWEVKSDLLGHLESFSSDAGVTKADWLQLVRGVVVVEGTHDKDVLRRLYGDELAEERLQVLPLRGHKNAQALIDSDFLAVCGIPLWVVFDNVGRRVLRLRTGRLREDATPEERSAFHLEKLKKSGAAVEYVPYPDPDIVCALPEQAVSRAFPNTSFDDGWTGLIRVWNQQQRPPNFKRWAIARMGLRDMNAGVFIGRVLDQVAADDRRMPALDRTVQDLLARVRRPAAD